MKRLAITAIALLTGCSTAPHVRLDMWDGRDYLQACDDMGGELFVTLQDMSPIEYICERVDY